MPYYLLNYLSPHTVDQFYALLLGTGGILTLLILFGAYLFRRFDHAPESKVPMPEQIISHGRTILWYGLAVLWLIDGLLQAQPSMSSSMFVDMILAPVLHGQPSFYLRLMGQGIQLWTDHQLVSAVLAVIIQVVIAFLLFVGKDRRKGRVGLWVSIVWGVLIWVFGEGLGGLLTGSPSLITGSPGSVTLYIFSAVLLLLPLEWWTFAKIDRMEKVLSLFWLLAVFWQVFPSSGFWTVSGLATLFSNSVSTPQPRFLAVPIQAVATIVELHPVFWNGLFAFIMLTLAVLFWIQKAKAWKLGLAMGWLFFIWWMGQDFGVVGGVGTDPNTAPILALLIVSLLWSDHSLIAQHMVSMWGRLQYSTSQYFGMMTRKGWIVYSFLSVLLLIFSISFAAIPSTSDSTLKNIQLYTTQRNHFSIRGLTKKWMSIVPAKKVVHLKLIATQTALGDIDFDGFANGYMTVVVPVDWTVDVAFTNQQSLVYNSVMVVPFHEIQAGSFTPVFRGAFTKNPTVGIKAGIKQSFHFIADRVGKYGIVSAVADGQADSGMWLRFDVSKSAKSPYIVAK